MTGPIPQMDLRPQLAALAPEIATATERVIASGWFILGPELESFEQEFAAYCGVRHAIGVASGTDALELALRAAEIGPGDEVITVAHTFIATPLAVAAVGATPVFVDVGLNDGLIDATLVEAALTKRTRAILPVHLYGRCAEMGPLLALAQSHGLIVIEDAAQAHGATWHGRRAGAIGDLGCFSFYPTKNLGALGDAGAVTTNDDDLARSLQLLRNYGQRVKYHHDVAGRNSRLDELHAAVLRVKLRHLDSFNAARRSVAARYHEALEGHPRLAMMDFDLDRDVVHQAVVRAPDRESLRRHLSKGGIGTQIHYPVPCHRQPIFLRDDGPQLPATDRLAADVLSLPMYPELTEAQVEGVGNALRRWRE